MNLVDLYLQKQQDKKIKLIGEIRNATITFSDVRTINTGTTEIYAFSIPLNVSYPVEQVIDHRLQRFVGERNTLEIQEDIESEINNYIRHLESNLLRGAEVTDHAVDASSRTYR